MAEKAKRAQQALVDESETEVARVVRALRAVVVLCVFIFMIRG